MLTIAEEIFLLVLNDAKGSIPNGIAIPLQFSLGGAVLSELFLSRKILLNEHKKIILIDESQCDEPILDQALEKIRISQSHLHKIPYWIKEINSQPKSFMKHLAEGLVHKEILHQQEKRYLWVVPYLVFPQKDASAKYWVKQHLRGVVLAGDIADTHTMMMLNLLCAGSLLDFVFNRDEIKAARQRIEKITRSTLLGQGVVQAMEEIDTAVNKLVVMSFSSETV